MKKTKFSEAQIIFALHQADTGVPVAEVCRKMGVSEATYYNWNRRRTKIMPVEFLSDQERERYQSIPSNLSQEDLSRYCFLSTRTAS